MDAKDDFNVADIPQFSPKRPDLPTWEELGEMNAQTIGTVEELLALTPAQRLERLEERANAVLTAWRAKRAAGVDV